jgi:hypothetical protein
MKLLITATTCQVSALALFWVCTHTRSFQTGKVLAGTIMMYAAGVLAPVSVVLLLIWRLQLD